jgi:hypothetical protein
MRQSGSTSKQGTLHLWRLRERKEKEKKTKKEKIDDDQIDEWPHMYEPSHRRIKATRDRESILQAL